MTRAILVPCLDELWDEFDAIAPNRDRSSDGWIGDAAHQQTVSDHNDDEIGRVPIRDADSKHEVHALDVDADLKVPGLTMEQCVQHILSRCRNGKETRLRYIIYADRIWEASNGWRQRTYTGANKHRQHAHFSSSYETAKESSRASWDLKGVPVALTADDRKWLAEQIDAAATAAANRVWDVRLTDPRTETDKTPVTKKAGTYLRYNYSSSKTAADNAAQHVIATLSALFKK